MWKGERRRVREIGFFVLFFCVLIFLAEVAGLLSSVPIQYCPIYACMSENQNVLVQFFFSLLDLFCSYQ